MNALDYICNIIGTYSGITNVYRDFMVSVIQDRAAAYNIPLEEYAKLLQSSPEEFTRLIDETAINETYFFREEKQFSFLQKNVFPELVAKKGSEPITIWSAACSTGEEPLSLYALSKFCRVSAKVIASDIDTNALSTLQKGVYSKNSFRTDGSTFASCLDLIGTREDSMFTVSPEALNDISVFRYNLSSKDAPPAANASMDIIFLRNVFIYFSNTLRKEILARIAGILKEGGYLFLSINEIASIDCNDDLPLVKESTGTLYYLRKCSDKKGHVVPERSVFKQETAAIPIHREQPLPIEKPVQKNSIPEKPTPKVPPTLIQPPLASGPAAQEVFYREIKKTLDRKDIAGAKEMLAARFFPPHEYEFKYYVTALIAMEEHDTQSALDFFTKAAILNRNFWPALFHMALLQKDLGKMPESLKTFHSCESAISSYIDSGNTSYEFLTEGFCADYFLCLCRNFINTDGA